MPAQTGFGLFLLGIAGRRRPPFFYAYSAFWLHLCAGALVLSLRAGDPGPGHWGTLALASLGVALLVYGIAGRRWEYLAATAAYGLGIYLLTAPAPDPRLWPAAALPPLGGLYCLMRAEWRAYAGQNPSAPPWPTWGSGLLLGCCALLMLVGLWI